MPITKILLYTTGAAVGSVLGVGLVTRQLPPNFLLSTVGFKRVTLTDSIPSGTAARQLTFRTNEPGALGPLTLTSPVLLFAFKPGSTLPIVRPYTPVNSAHGDDNSSTVELCVKKYPGGPMSTFLHSLSPSAAPPSKDTPSDSQQDPQPTLYMRRLPIGPKYTPNSAKSVALIAGGSGITPCFQLLNSILTDPAQASTKVTLVMGAPKRDEEMLKPQIDALEQRYAKEGRFKVVRVFGDGETSQGELKGRISKELLKDALPNAGDQGAKLYVCGPEGMQHAVLGKGRGHGGWVKELGWRKDQVTVF